MGWLNDQFSLVVIGAGAPGTGLFVYSPTPGAGNLIASIAPAPGVDIYGNSYLQGFAVYAAGSATTYAQLNAAILTLANSVGGGTWTIGASSLTADLVINAGGAGGNLYIARLNATAASIVGNQINAANTPETWHTLGLNVGFAALAGFAVPQYRFEPMGSGGQVRLRGGLSLTAGAAIGTAFATMPATYQPSFSQYFLTPNSLAGGVGTQAESVRVINAAGGGFLELGTNGNNGNYILLEGITYVLD
jgi:hypothetical protein